MLASAARWSSSIRRQSLVRLRFPVRDTRHDLLHRLEGPGCTRGRGSRRGWRVGRSTCWRRSNCAFARPPHTSPPATSRHLLPERDFRSIPGHAKGKPRRPEAPMRVYRGGCLKPCDRTGTTRLKPRATPPAISVQQPGHHDCVRALQKHLSEPLAGTFLHTAASGLRTRPAAISPATDQATLQ